jgi:hypothetical protein
MGAAVKGGGWKLFLFVFFLFLLHARVYVSGASRGFPTWVTKVWLDLDFYGGSVNPPSRSHDVCLSLFGYTDRVTSPSRAKVTMFVCPCLVTRCVSGRVRHLSMFGYVDR